MGIGEDTATSSGIPRVACPNAALHSERRDILLFPLLDGICGIDRPVRGADHQDALRDRINSARQLRLRR